MDAPKKVDYTNTFCHLMNFKIDNNKDYEDNDFQNWKKDGKKDYQKTIILLKNL